MILVKAFVVLVVVPALLIALGLAVGRDLARREDAELGVLGSGTPAVWGVFFWSADKSAKAVALGQRREGSSLASRSGGTAHVECRLKTVNGRSVFASGGRTRPKGDPRRMRDQWPLTS